VSSTHPGARGGVAVLISIIAAVAENGVIGKDNALPWRLSSDLKRFKALTMGKPIIMGRKTYESIGKPLPGRTNIVVTRNRAFTAEGCMVVDSLEAAIDAANETGADEAVVIGGSAIYQAALPLAQRLYLTEVAAACEGDTFFPDWVRSEWVEISREDSAVDDRNSYPYCFRILERA
jgi:dihydrofolate reductase